MRNNLISCIREWLAAAAKMANTQPIIRFSWGLNLWVTLVSPREKYWKIFLVMKQRERRKVFLKKYYWDIVELQCCISFRYTAKWICFTGRFWYNILDCIIKTPLYGGWSCFEWLRWRCENISWETRYS